jgi:hypothetical protein
MVTTLDFFFTAFDFVFDFWPFLVLSAIKTRRSPLKSMLLTWGFWAVVRVFLVFNPNPLEATLFIPEPLNTVLFFVAGLVLAGVYFGLRFLERGRLIRKTSDANSVEKLLDLSPTEFEDAVVELFRAYGHKARRTGGVGDHGVDVIVETRDGQKIVVQCKRWKGYVGEPVVRDFYGVMHHEKADRGLIVTTSTFSRPAQEWAEGKPIALYNGEKFLQLWQRAQRQRQAATEGAS